MFSNFLSRILPHKKIIFIVEDNRVYAKTLTGFLSTRFSGIRICTFYDGETCLKELYRKPSIIIMDYLLNTSHVDAATGFSIIEKIKSESPDSNIILLSAKTELDIFVKAISVYGCTYLRKDEQPFNKVEQFIKAIFYSSKATGF
jgi:DNA-binding response OmpR family regulator